MDNKPSKFWAYMAVIVGSILLLAGIAATVGYLGIPFLLSGPDILSYQLGQMAAVFLGLVSGSLAVIHGLGSIGGRRSNPLKMPSFYIFWIMFALVLAIGSLSLNLNIASNFLFPPLFFLGAALSVLAVLAWAYRKMGWPITWRQAALAFACGSTLSIFLAIFLESVLPFLAYMLIRPLGFLADEFTNFGWGSPGLIERLFASPLILIFLIATALEAPIPEEFAKALGLPMFGRARIQNERQAFAIGMACGAGFAILENMLYEGLYAYQSGWAWGGITLLRAIGAVMHPIGTGIVALGWYRMKKGGVGELLKAYLLAVGLHTLWNGGFQPLVYLTGLDYFAGISGPSFSFFGQPVNVLLVAYLLLLSIGLWWLLRRIVSGLSLGVTTDLTPVMVSRRSVALWALACSVVIVPIGAALGSSWKEILAVATGH